ncbi:MAG: Filamentation induced by cAMP protein Fic [Candidatus Beckwithbacteria bacterium GW2011_GWA2_43_10]|uniref:Filamentation induced by cAMP protein Fic n=1 Tax=Candidatus Beckwithbacteria bacterium GW2011_GWA2_43_10 TaxID=1618369 RepID=A0A0G1C3N8_9BACT|nr:MAG: Filamentation induced by cAMP protein Fic [Candidatus Beckwithbacteria bacterium GW2011_GWA2_43_10]
MKQTSAKPKGATSYKETKFGIIPRSRLLKLEIEGTKKGLNFIFKLVSKDKSVEITPELICQLHQKAFGWIFPKWAGKYRKIQVTVSGKETPSFYLVPEMVMNLCEDLKERLSHLPKRAEKSFIIEAVKLLAWFQHKFVFIHPFQDYNGRMSRMLTILLLLKLRLPPTEIKVEKKADRSRYIKAMQKADDGDISFLENIISETLLESFSRI